MFSQLESLEGATECQLSACENADKSADNSIDLSKLFESKTTDDVTNSFFSVTCHISMSRLCCNREVCPSGCL